MSKDQKIQEAVETLSNAVNSFSNNQEAFIKAFCRQHRTLQQSMFGLMVALIGHMASDEYDTDARNDYSKKIAKAMYEGIREMYAEQEAEYWRSMGYSTEEVEAKKKKFIEEFDKNPSMYLALPCI